jgi:hypothetical protein
MEPKLCFLLCQTPIIYIKKEICRCSGGGLMTHNREKCENQETYSAYAEDKFYTEHAHLFNYQIQFTSCELWNTSGFYDTLQVKIDKSSVKSPLNQLEQCAATCLDRNATTKSIGKGNISRMQGYANGWTEGVWTSPLLKSWRFL